MHSFVFVTLAILSVQIVESFHSTTWGNVSDEAKSVELVTVQTHTPSHRDSYVYETVTFPEVRCLLNLSKTIELHSCYRYQDLFFDEVPSYKIVGIKYEDFNEFPANVSIYQGGIDHPYVVFQVRGHPGQSISSTFLIYMEDLSDDLQHQTEPVIIKHFLESRFDVNIS